VWIETPSRNKKKKKRGREKGSRKEEMRCIPQERAANRRTLLRRDEVRWRRKAGRKSLSRQRLKEDLKHLPRQRREGGAAGTKAPPRNKEPRILRSYSRNTAVLIRCKECGPSYAEAVRKARDEISLEKLGIGETRLRRTQTDDLLIEISEEDFE